MYKYPVTERALMARINRVLKREGRDHKLCKARGFRVNGWRHPDNNLGWYYVVDWYLNLIVDHHVNLEAYGRELGVLGCGEKLEEN